jgi:hypothetical protein
MDITLSHAKNPLIGWDIAVIVKASIGETITMARIDVNGFPEFDEQLPNPLNQWQKNLTQQGTFPGDNKVLVTITNDKGERTTDEDDWS